MAEQVTTMVLKVDLECRKCRKKVDKVLGEFCGKIRERVYDEKKGTVTIKVVCCSPEKIKEELLRKGGCSIKLIEVVVPKPPDGKPDGKPKEAAEKPPGPVGKPPVTIAKPTEGEGPEKAKKPEGADQKPKEAAEKPKEPVRVCCQQCFLWYPGHGGPRCPCHLGLCIHCCGGLRFHGHIGPPPCYPYGWYGHWATKPGLCSCGCGRSDCASRCQNYYFSEENPSACTIM